MKPNADGVVVELLIGARGRTLTRLVIVGGQPHRIIVEGVEFDLMINHVKNPETSNYWAMKYDQRRAELKERYS